MARRKQSEGRDRGPGGRARSAILLGPQRLQVTLGPVASEVAPDGKIATVTAGWQEREGEDEELDAELGGRSLNLRLYERFDRVSDEDPELARAHRETQDRLKLLRRAYNVRLSRLMDAREAVGRLTGGPDVLEPEREAALDGIRRLDNHQLSRVREIREEFAERHAPAELPAVARERAEIAASLEEVDAVVVAGGHVAVLLNRLNLFGLGELLAGKILIALSGGAMVLSPRVVLLRGAGLLCWADTKRGARVTADIAERTLITKARALTLGPYAAVSNEHLYDIRSCRNMQAGQALSKFERISIRLSA